MNLIKKILAVTLCTVLLLATLTVSTSAVAVPTITVGSSSALAEGLCSVNISISNNPGVIGARLAVIYDSSALTLKASGDSGLLKDRTETPTPDILYWEDAFATVNNTANGVIATLTFAVKKEAQPGKYPISIGYNTGDIYNIDLEDVNFSVESGFITVISNTCYHTETTWLVTKEPTVNEDGIRSEVCTECGTILNEELIPATGDETGTCGELLWSYNTTATRLSINGVGNIPDFTSSYLSQPWYLRKLDIKALEINVKTEIIGKYAFSKHTSLETALLPDTLRIISDNAFEDCVMLSSINFPLSLQEISHSAFAGCSSLTDISCLPENLVSIGKYAFQNCTGLTGILRIKSAMYIGDYAFKGCDNLEALVLPDIMGYIGKDILSEDRIFCREGSAGAEAGYPVIGDFDENGTLTATDAVGLRKELLSSNSYNIIADINEDSSVNVTDIVRIKKELAK